MNEIRKNKQEIHKNRTLLKKPGQIPDLATIVCKIKKIFIVCLLSLATRRTHLYLPFQSKCQTCILWTNHIMKGKICIYISLLLLICTKNCTYGAKGSSTETHKSFPLHYGVLKKISKAYFNMFILHLI